MTMAITTKDTLRLRSGQAKGHEGKSQVRILWSMFFGAA